MWFTKKTDVLQHQIDGLKMDIAKLMNRLDIQTIRMDALMKLYPYGSNSDGTPRKKPGRKTKVQA